MKNKLFRKITRSGTVFDKYLGKSDLKESKWIKDLIGWFPQF